jgi:hypothetical protein
MKTILILSTFFGHYCAAQVIKHGQAAQGTQESQWVKVVPKRIPPVLGELWGSAVWSTGAVACHSTEADGTLATTVHHKQGYQQRMPQRPKREAINNHQKSPSE